MIETSWSRDISNIWDISAKNYNKSLCTIVYTKLF